MAVSMVRRFFVFSHHDLSISHLSMGRGRPDFLCADVAHCAHHYYRVDVRTQRPCVLGILSGNDLVEADVQSVSDEGQSQGPRKYPQGAVVRFCSQPSGSIRYLGCLRLSGSQLPLADEKRA